MPKPILLIMKLAPTIVILGSLLTAGSIHAKWSRIPIVKERPVDIAVKGAHSNASLDSSSGFGQVDAILTDDITAPATVSAGKSFVVINLGKPVLISQSSFVNDGIEGRATLSASADKNGWAVLEEKVFSAADRTVEFKFAGMQAKFIKLEFALSKGGMIRNLLFFGGQTDRGYALKQDKEGKRGVPMNLIGGLGGARVIYAAPKPANGVDTAVTYNKFAFPESDEKYRTVIYDLGQLRILNEFSSLHSPRPTRFEVFAFDNLPEKEDWRGRLAFDPSEFNAKTPVAVAEDTRGLGSLKAKPAKPVKTRYLALRWEPEFNPPDAQVEGAAMGFVEEIKTSTSTTTQNGDGTKTTTNTEVGDAFGADAANSEVDPDNPEQAQAQADAIKSNDTTTTTTTTTDSTGNVIEESVQQGETTTTTTTDSEGNKTTTTTTDDSSSTTSTATTTSTEGATTQTTTNSDGNLGGGNTPNPGGGVTPGAPPNGGGTPVISPP